jgi:hypothetical protein
MGISVYRRRWVGLWSVTFRRVLEFFICPLFEPKFTDPIKIKSATSEKIGLAIRPVPPD